MRISRIVGPLALMALLLSGCSTMADNTGTGSDDSGSDDSGLTIDKTATVVTGSDAGIKKIRIAAMGDMLAHGGVNMNAKVPGGYDYTQFFDNFKDVYADADLVYCNQEAPSTSAFPVQDYPRFNAPEEFARDLHASGCNMVNLANNHSFDQRQEGASKTREVWEKIDPLLLTGVNRSAEEQKKIAYTEVDGVKVAFLGYSMISNMGRQTLWGMNHTDDKDLLEAQLKEARANADLVIVSMHWGVEYVQTSNQEQQDFAQYLADQGVDVILGMHAHVLQEVEWLDRADGGRTLVWYSLGNLLSAQITLEQRTGGVALFDVYVQDGVAKIQNVEFVPTYTFFPYSFNGTNYVSGRGLELRKLADSATLFKKAGYSSTVNQTLKHVQTVLGPDVLVNTGTR